jgi:YspA, cpYpsA-related SLOG family
MNEFKLIIAGGRDFSDAALLERVVFAMADTEYADVAISIVSGMARGADALGYRFAKAHDIKCYEFPADWDTYGKRAGYMRNEQMGRFSGGLLAFHDGASRGTNHMIQFMRSLHKPVTVINY